MTIVLPIVFFVLVMGLVCQRVTARIWCLVAVWILLVMLVSYFKPMKMELNSRRVSTGGAAARSLGAGATHQ